MQKVDRVGAISLEEFEEKYAKPGIPVILTEASKGWPALNWTPKDLADRFGEEWVQVTPSASLEEATSEMTLADYVAYLDAPDERLLYMTSWNFREPCPQLLEDFETPVYFREDWLQEMDEDQQFDLMWLFLGPADAGFRLHVDVGQTSNWNTQLTGKKRWLLYSPEQVDLLYDGEVDAFDPNFLRYPRFRRAEAHECIVHAGETIFTPSGWWHQTKNLETGLALTANYANGSNYGRVMQWLEEVGPQLEVDSDMLEFARCFRQIVERKLQHS